VFTSLSSNSYLAFFVSESFQNDTSCFSCSRFRPQFDASYSGEKIPRILERLRHQYAIQGLERLSPSHCLEEYAQNIQSKRRNLLLVARDSDIPSVEQSYPVSIGPHIYYAGYLYAEDVGGAITAGRAYKWMCSGLDNDPLDCSSAIESVKNAPEQWTVRYYCNSSPGLRCRELNWPVEYCLSERPKEHCKLHFEPTIAIYMTVFNLVKVAIMFFIAFNIRDAPLLSVGDAVASFLDKADTSTRNMCLVTLGQSRNLIEVDTRPLQWHDRLYRWKDATSKARRGMTLLLYVANPQEYVLSILLIRRRDQQFSYSTSGCFRTFELWHQVGHDTERAHTPRLRYVFVGLYLSSLRNSDINNLGDIDPRFVPPDLATAYSC
jgi:hypothetical protein